MSNALTPEEWGESEFESFYGTHKTSAHVDHKGRWFFASTGPEGEREAVILNQSDDDGRACKALAALALRDQPFGFTWDDVDALRYYADQNIEDAGPFGEGWTSDETAKAQSTCRSLADRIAALLPPR